MASNVFGNPITEKTLRQMPKCQDKEQMPKCQDNEQMPKCQDKEITVVDRAYEALLMKNADNKDVKARELVDRLKVKCDNGLVRCTLCVIYNATGNKLTYAGSHDWQGHIDASPFPKLLENGQWGAFLHVQDIGLATGSVASVMYNGKDENGKGCDWILSWYNPWDRVVDKNKVYTKIREADECKEVNWEDVYNNLKKSGLNHEDTCNGCYSTVISGNSITPIVEGIMTLKKAWIK